MYRKPGGPLAQRAISTVANVKHIDPIGNGSPGYEYGNYKGQPTQNMTAISEIARLQAEHKCSFDEASRIYDKLHANTDCSDHAEVKNGLAQCVCGALFSSAHGAIACPACRIELKAESQKAYYRRKVERENKRKEENQ